MEGLEAADEEAGEHGGHRGIKKNLEKRIHADARFGYIPSMLGVFDSGFGGLTVLRAIRARLPSLSTCYFGDNARAPYGTRSEDEIFAFTLEGVRFLFAQGCPLVILACNTASARALRRIQQEVLPKEFPDRRVLGVIRPTVEALASLPKPVGVFATPATVTSGAWTAECAHLGFSPTQVAGAGLVDLVERGEETSTEAERLVQTYAQALLAARPDVRTAVLGCTHYPLLFPLFRRALPADVGILSQGDLVAASLADYLRRHPNMGARVGSDGSPLFYTSGSAGHSPLATRFLGEDVTFQRP